MNRYDDSGSKIGILLYLLSSFLVAAASPIKAQSIEAVPLMVFHHTTNTAQGLLAPACTLALMTNGPSAEFTIQNRSTTQTAYAIASNFTGTALDGNIIESGNTCAVLPPGNVCTLTYTPGSTPVPLTEFTIKGTNTRSITAAISIQSSAIPNTTLSVDATGTVPASLSGSTTNSITVTNTGTEIAYNVRATLPALWTTGGAVTQDASNCTTIAPNGTCLLTFSSTQAFVPEGNIAIIGDNISNAPITALAFTVQGYLVWQVSPTIEVIDTSDSGILRWSGFPGTTGASSLTDGFTNTDIIFNYSITNPGYNGAANVCYNSTNGGSAIGEWYMPAICQLGTEGTSIGAGCPGGLSTIEALFQLGFGGLQDQAGYWSSTEVSNPAQSDTNAWAQYFALDGTGFQLTPTKSSFTSFFRVRCARSLLLPP